ncbi:hypothetical protein RMSM_07282 [Rhodopirellula maiorica SM1]|uniref:Uncharacterized protein n=1 Tax=Rhodopirellula maiorica SM1 TaxID=1265738 RepID=M5R8V3_9BACT|nr:hypothetical protein RMSM_07282 [Rhodopirellula maiorica SM1]
MPLHPLSYAAGLEPGQQIFEQFLNRYRFSPAFLLPDSGDGTRGTLHYETAGESNLIRSNRKIV